jgi:16S rRNA (uracil1498-N3)-methyltransferase
MIDPQAAAIHVEETGSTAMSDRRFHHANLDAAQVELDAEQAAHARRSLRLQVGDDVELFDGQGGAAAGRIVQCDRGVRIAIESRRRIARPVPWIDLATAVPKGARADVLVEKASELGADRLTPLICQRSVVEPGENKLERFSRLAIESAKQCGRSHFMAIQPPTPLRAFLAQADHDRRLIADEAAGRDPGETVQNLLGDLGGVARLAILVGPEGGWSESERIEAKQAGFQPVRLGPNILRVETAALAAVAIARRGS